MAFDPYSSALQNYWGLYQGGSPALPTSYAGGNGGTYSQGGSVGNAYAAPPIGIASAGSPYADLIKKLQKGYNPLDSMRGGNLYDQMLSNGLYSQMTGWKPTFPMGG